MFIFNEKLFILNEKYLIFEKIYLIKYNCFQEKPFVLNEKYLRKYIFVFAFKKKKNYIQQKIFDT